MHGDIVGWRESPALPISARLVDLTSWGATNAIEPRPRLISSIVPLSNSINRSYREAVQYINYLLCSASETYHLDVSSSEK